MASDLCGPASVSALKREPELVVPLSSLSDTKPPQDDSLPTATVTSGREKPSRNKKESLKKRESRAAVGLGGDSSCATPDPRTHEPPASETSPLRYQLPPPKPSDFEPPREPVLAFHHTVAAPDGHSIDFYETSENVYNKRNFHYAHCIADPAFPSSIYYRQTDAEPYGPRMSFEDCATHIFFDSTARHLTTDKGFRMSRANLAVREGRWYWECRITRGTVRRADPTDPNNAGYLGKSGHDQPAVPSHGHVRIGWARREASLDAPVGFDAYSYGLRDVAGQKVYMSRPRDFFPPGEDICEGDVIGLEIRLPSERLQRKVLAGSYNPAVDFVENGNEADGLTANSPVGLESEDCTNIVRDRLPIRFKTHIYFEKIDYGTVKELEDLMNPARPVHGTTATIPPIVASSSRPTAAPASTDPPSPNHPLFALRTLPQSYIRVYKNGVLMGTAFENLLAFLPPASRPMAQIGARTGLDDGMLGYYPAVSVFRGGAAEVNFGPDFWFPPADAGTGLRAVSERHAEQIAEDVVYDIVDEVDFWMRDGGVVLDRTSVDDTKVGPAGLTPGRGEIKVLVQDD